MPVSEAKEEYARNFNRCFDTYDKVLFCNIENVTSQQLHKVRRDLRGKAEMLMGKKTMQKRIISLRAASDNATDVDKKMKEVFCDDRLLCGMKALVFTNDEVKTVTDIMSTHRKQAPARIGVVSPTDVVVPAGNTGMEPTMTSFFQALNIQTKISKGTVEITAEKKVLAVGDKVDSSTAALLQKLKISPFFYQVEVESLWERGTLFTKEDLSITDDDLEQQLIAGINNITALSLGSGVLTECSFPHVIKDGFKNLLAAAVATDYEFDEFDGKALKKSVLEGGSAPAAAAPAAAAAAPAAAAAADDDEESDDDMGMGGLF